jgi:hypothetical protein
VYPLLDRVTYSTPFVEKYIVDNQSDKLIIIVATSLWISFSIKNRQRYLLLVCYVLLSLVTITFQESMVSDIVTMASLPFLLFLFVLGKYSKISFELINKKTYINSISVLMIIVATLALLVSGMYISSSNVTLPPINYFYYVYLILSLFSPMLLVIIGLYALIKLIRVKVTKKLEPDDGPTGLFNTHHGYVKLHSRLLFLISIFSISYFIMLIPHLQTINPDNQIIGADTIDYANYLNSMNNPSTIQEFFEAFVLLFEGDRSLSLVTFYTISHVIPTFDLVHTMDLLPFILAPLLILSVYFLTREITFNHVTSLLAAFITGVSFHTLIGLYGGLYANWFSLIFVNLTILYFVRTFRKQTTRNLLIFSALMVVVLLTHEPTWPILVLVLLMSLIIIVFANRRAKKITLYLFLSMVPSFLLEFIRMIITNNAGVIRNINYATDQGFGIHDFSTIWNNLITTTQTYLAGQFGNSIIYFLVIYWLYKSSLSSKSNIVIAVFLTIPIIPIFFGESVTLSRVLFEIPFQIPAAMGLTYLKKNYGNIFVFAICLWFIVIGIRATSNFYLDT